MMRQRRLPRRPDDGQRHPGPVPGGRGRAGTAAAAQCLHRPHLRLRLRRRPGVLPDRHRRRAARGARADGPAAAVARRAGRDRRADEAGRADRAAQLPAGRLRRTSGSAVRAAATTRFDVLELRADRRTAAALARTPRRAGALELPDGSTRCADADLRARRRPDQRPAHGHGPHRRDRHPRAPPRLWTVTQRRRHAAQLPCARRAVPGARAWTARRRRPSCAGCEGHGLRAAGQDVRSWPCASTAPPTRTLRTCTTAICCTTRTRG